jgi:Uma2 family endonuclease
MTIVQARLTYADLLDLPEDGNRYELLEGELVVSPAPTPRHQRVVVNGTVFLRRAEDAGYGSVYIAPIYVVFDEEHTTEPDLLFIRRDNLAIVRDDAIHGVPDLVVEVLSPGSRRRDMRVKLQIYARFGVPYYWIADPGPRTVQPYELTAQGYDAQPPLHADDSLSCPLFPDITTRVGDLFK